MANCNSFIPNICGKGGVNIPTSSCSAIRFVGTDDVSVNQGDCIDLTNGVHAYDGNGNEIPFTVSPSEIPCCDVGEYEVVYEATGMGDKLVPSMCLGDPMLHIAECGMARGSVKRTITVKPYASVCNSNVCCASVTC